jgi:hypothetical protein
MQRMLFHQCIRQLQIYFFPGSLSISWHTVLEFSYDPTQDLRNIFASLGVTRRVRRIATTNGLVNSVCPSV